MRGFFERAAAWKALLVIVGYLVYYVLVAQVVGAVFGDEIDTDDVLATATSIFFALVLPIALGAVGLVGFAASLGWLRELFAPQPVRGRRWMWIAPVLVGAAIVGHLAATDWAAWTSGEVVLILLLGLCVGVAEELATRGLAVKILRDAGHRERFVMVVSSALFALMHLINLLAGMELSTVVATVGYTFGFGVCMYLTMRVTGTIWAAIVLHACTDPSTFLSTGGLDEAVSDQTGGWSLFAAAATALMILFGLVAIVLVRDDESAPAR